MREVLLKIGPVLRSLGFRGSGQNFRKTEADFVFVVNFQGSRWSERFYVNLGAQPTFIPAERDADLRKLKEYECIFRRRVGQDWLWDLPETDFANLVAELTSTQADFFGRAKTLRTAIVTDTPEILLNKFSSGLTLRVFLHLARAALAQGAIAKARELAEIGLQRIPDRATVLREELQCLLAENPLGRASD